MEKEEYHILAIPAYLSLYSSPSMVELIGYIAYINSLVKYNDNIYVYIPFQSTDSTINGPFDNFKKTIESGLDKKYLCRIHYLFVNNEYNNIYELYLSILDTYKNTYNSINGVVFVFTNNSLSLINSEVLSNEATIINYYNTLFCDWLELDPNTTTVVSYIKNNNIIKDKEDKIVVSSSGICGVYLTDTKNIFKKYEDLTFKAKVFDNLFLFNYLIINKLLDNFIVNDKKVKIIVA